MADSPEAGPGVQAVGSGEAAVQVLPTETPVGAPQAGHRPPASGQVNPARAADHVAQPVPNPGEIGAVAVPFSVPLSRRFRGVDHREGLLLCGPSGWAEWAPFPEYDDWEAARWLAAAVEAGWGTWPAAVRDSVPVNVIVPALPNAEVATYVTDAAAQTGCDTYKVKVGEAGDALADDLARVATVRAALSEAGISDPLIRLDANGAWTVTQARRAARMFAAEFGPVLDYLEQPCRTTTELAELRYRLVDDEVHLRIAVDEGLRRARNLFASDLAATLRAAGDVLIVKVAPVGGVRRSLRLVADIGLPVVVSGAMDTSIGLTAGLALAAAVPDLAGACGLGTGLLLADDVCASTLVPREGQLVARRRVPDEGAMGRAADALGPERTMWWRERLARCARLLTVI